MFLRIVNFERMPMAALWIQTSTAHFSSMEIHRSSRSSTAKFVDASSSKPKARPLVAVSITDERISRQERYGEQHAIIGRSKKSHERLEDRRTNTGDHGWIRCFSSVRSEAYPSNDVQCQWIHEHRQRSGRSHRTADCNHTRVRCRLHPRH